MISKAIRDKANRYLTEGRVAALSVNDHFANFAVAGSGDEPYKVKFVGDWVCNCPSQVTVCAHILACQKITKIETSRRVMFSDDNDDLTAFIHSAFNPEGQTR